MGSLTLDGRWGPREETLGVSTSRASMLLHGLSAAHPAYARWCRKGMSRKQAMQQRLDDLSPEALAPYFAQKKGQGMDAISRWGFCYDFWNGAANESDAVDVMFFIGEGGDRFFWNHVDISLPKPDSRYPITTPAELRPLLAALVDSFDPKICAVGNRALYLENHDIRLDREGRPGWLTWLRGAVHPVPDLGDDASVEAFHGGALITLGQRPMSEDNPEDIARLRDAWLKMRAAGYAI